MRLGIDFGTTRTVVAAVDRGNYPVIEFEGPDNEVREWFPPLVAARAGECLYGWQAWQAQQDPSYTVVRSIKRYLQHAGPNTQVELGGHYVSLIDLLTGMVAELRRNLMERSSMKSGGARLEVMLGVPANANSNQRFLTSEAFRRAGFEVLGLLNEPSAASIEYGHRTRDAARGKLKDHMLVYDLGGGTFDVSLVEVGERSHSVFASEGIPTLGGDDFDEILADMALDAAAISATERDTLTQSEWHRLHEECREKKEALHPNTRRIAIDLQRVREDWPHVFVPANDYYERCRPLVEETVHAVCDLMAAHNLADAQMLYVAGGGAELPVVARILREQFGRRVHRSAHTRSATAIGLAIQADAEAGYVLRDRFMRHFGVWREAESGQSIIFDPLFSKGTTLPGPAEPPVCAGRAYYPVHNVGHFRYLECSHVDKDGRPTGDITLWDDILFPFDPGLRDQELNVTPVVQALKPAFGEVEERYTCDSGGAVTVTISNLSAGYKRDYRLGRWAAKAPIAPGTRSARKRV